MDNLLGTRLEGRYLIEQPLGAGGMANVYKGQDVTNGRPVAIKVLRQEFMDNADLVRRFKNEAKAVSLLDHPNITKVYDVGVGDQLQYIVMEYIDGITLKEYMEYRNRPLTYKETLHFVTQVLAALQHAHDKGIVHRDIKPQNIMLLADGSIKVMDFGIARFSRSENQTITDKAIGSVHYISPEQAKGNATDVRADIYSVGVMMYEMLSGHLPFESDSPVSVAIKQISEEAKPLRELNPSVPPALEAIIARAMAKEPRDRYPSAREMMAELEEFRRNPGAVKAAPRPQQAAQQEAPTRYMDKVTVNKTSQKQQSGARPAGKKTQLRPAPVRTGQAAAVRGKRNLALPILAGVAAAFAIGAVILVVLIFKTSGSDMFTKRANVELPNFTGLAWEKIQQDEAYATFKFDIQPAYNSEYEAGTVYSQSPKPPKTVKEGAKITLYVSQGAQKVKVPNVIGQSKNDAMKALSAEGIVFKIVTEETEDQAAVGKVIRTEPGAGEQVRSGDKTNVVTITVARQKVENETEVPTVLGMTQEDAKVILEKNFLNVGNITTRDDASPAGTILEQSPLPGDVATKGSSVHLVVSTGAVPAARNVTVVFADTVDEGEWTLTLEGGQFATYHTSAGVAASWTVSFTDTGVKTILLSGPTGQHFASVDFSPTGGDTTIGPIGGSSAPPPVGGDTSEPTPPPTPPTEGGGDEGNIDIPAA